MPTLTFSQPDTVEEVLDVLANYGESAKIIAGGTAVAILLRQRLLDPDVLVSLGRLPHLDGIEMREGQLKLGALATHAEVASSAVVREIAPALADSFQAVGNVRVRSVATVGGVLAEADYASDPPCVLVGLDAEVVTAGPDGQRIIPLTEFCLGFYETALLPEEVITSVRLPVPPRGTCAAYHKFKTRSSEDRPCVGVFAAVRFRGESQICDDLRIAVGAASETPQRFTDLEDAASGQVLSAEVIDDVAATYANRIDVIEDARGSGWYRREMIRVWVRRTLARCACRSAVGEGRE
jgi:carbon-monoxide dehydrogenase medium subunit